MLVILHPNTEEKSEEFGETWRYLESLEGIKLNKHDIQGDQQKLTEIYLLGDTHTLDKKPDSGSIGLTGQTNADGFGHRPRYSSA